MTRFFFLSFSLLRYKAVPSSLVVVVVGPRPRKQLERDYQLPAPGVSTLSPRYLSLTQSRRTNERTNEKKEERKDLLERPSAEIFFVQSVDSRQRRERVR